MSRNELIQRIRDLITEDKLQEGFELLNKNLRKDAKTVNHQFIVLNRRFNKNKRANLNDTISIQEYRQEENRISLSILEYIENLKEEDLISSPSTSIRNIANPILLIAHSEASQDEMQKFFSLLHFSAAQIIYSTTFQSIEDIEIIIFDNRDLKDCPSPVETARITEEEKALIQQRINLMEEYLDKTDTFLIHMGERLGWINHNRNRVYASNSKISLHARIMELLHFIDSYKT